MLGFLLGTLVGAALGIVLMGLLHDMEYYYPEPEEEDEEYKPDEK